MHEGRNDHGRDPEVPTVVHCVSEVVSDGDGRGHHPRTARAPRP